MIFKLTFKKLGGHVHFTIRAGKTESGQGLCAENCCMREDEWESFHNVLRRGSADGGKIIFVEEA
jgi:hypothetical protein